MISKPNCIIKYKKVVQSATEVDPITCLPILVEEEVEESFLASLEKDTTEPAYDGEKGRDYTDHFFSGRSELKPAEMPGWWQPGTMVDIEWIGTNQKVKGYVYFSLHMSRFNLDNCFGASIEVKIRY